MTFEDDVEKGLCRCLAAAGAVKDPVHGEFDGISLLLGLSGGIDSTALLCALQAIKERQRSRAAGGSLGLELAACHVNHQLRGAESAADQQYCKEICDQLGVPLTAVELTTGRASEAELREARYAKLVRVAKQLSAPYIVTAHNLDDQVETMFFRLIRGSSLRGLVGMDPARPMDVSMWPILLRPMLDISRDQIQAYLTEKGISGRLDGSNSDERYSRNFLRKQIVAPLKQKFPGMAGNIEHFRQTLQVENDYMAEQAAALYNRAITRSNELLLDVLDGEHAALTARVITTYIEEAGIMPSFERVKRIISLIDQVKSHPDKDFVARQSLGQHLELLVSKNSILLKPLYELTTSPEEILGRLDVMAPIPIRMPRPGRSAAITIVPWLDFAVSVVEIADPGGGGKANQDRPFDRKALAVPVQLAGLTETIYLRPRMPGDHLQPVGMQEQVRLKQYLHANKSLFEGARHIVPTLNDVLALRLFPVFVLGEGQEVIWVPGFGLSEKIKAGPGASHLISLMPLSHGLQAADGIDSGTC